MEIQEPKAVVIQNSTLEEGQKNSIREFKVQSVIESQGSTLENISAKAIPAFSGTGFTGLPQEKIEEPVVRPVSLEAAPTNNTINEDTSGSSLVMNSYPSNPQAVEDIEEEAQNERERRRSSMREQEKLAFMAKFNIPKHADRVASKIFNLLGNIDPAESESTSHARIEHKKTSFLTKEIAENLRWYREYSKNYTEIYLTKTKLLYLIVLKILGQYQSKVKEAQDYFKKMSSSMIKYFEGKVLTEEIVLKMCELKEFIKSFDLQRKSIDEEFMDLDQLFVTLGESQKNSQQRLGHVPTFTPSSTVMYRASVIYENLEMDESKKFKIDPSCPEMVKQIIQSAEYFQNSFARLFRKISKSKSHSGLFELFEYFADAFKNPFVLEHKMVLNFQSCSYVMFTCIIPKLFEVHGLVSNTIKQGKEILDVLYKRDPHLLSELVLFQLSSTLPSQYKHYIKSKLGLDDKKILKDEDLKEFLVHKHLLSYPRVSLLWKAAQLCIYKTKAMKPLQIILVIDVVLLLTSVYWHNDGLGVALRIRGLCLPQKPRP
jgi:hypothetical protein